MERNRRKINEFYVKPNNEIEINSIFLSFSLPFSPFYFSSLLPFLPIKHTRKSIKYTRKSE